MAGSCVWVIHPLYALLPAFNGFLRLSWLAGVCDSSSALCSCVSVCVCCGMTVWDWLRGLKRRKSELAILGGSSCLASPLRLQGLGALFLPVSFSITNHCYLLFLSPLQSSSHGGCRSHVCRYASVLAMRRIGFRMRCKSAPHLTEPVLA